jgi:hypothetical protein
MSERKESVIAQRKATAPQTMPVAVIGTTLLVALLLLVILVPQPPLVQENTFKVILALGSAGFAAMLPGQISAKLPKGVQATGALAVFAVVFFFLPTQTTLIDRIDNLQYGDPISIELRRLRDRFLGPFNSPEKRVILVFDDKLDEDQAKVCPDSDFYMQNINIASEDFTIMFTVKSASEPLMLGCTHGKNDPERVLISLVKMKKLLKVGDQNIELPKEKIGIARAIPSYIIPAN